MSSLDRSSIDRTQLNDELTAMLAGFGWTAKTEAEYDALNDLTHEVADKVEGLLNADREEPKFSLMVAHNGAFVSRHFDAEDEAIDAIGEAIGRKMTFPDDVVTLVIGRVGP